MKRAKKIVLLAGMTTVAPAFHYVAALAPVRSLEPTAAPSEVSFTISSDEWRPWVDAEVCEMVS